jgi:hypothetical protein
MVIVGVMIIGFITRGWLGVGISLAVMGLAVVLMAPLLSLAREMDKS